MGIESWSTTPGSNTSAPPDGAPEGMAPSAVNDTMRQQMADHRTQWNDAQWLQYGDGDGAGTITYVAANQFKVEGTDVTGHYHVGRRVKVNGTTTGTVHGTITAVSFSTDTTVTVQLDSGTLQNEALTVWTSILRADQSALPSSSWSFRNLLINGDMRITQRGSATINSGTATYGQCDRWFGVGVASSGVFDLKQTTSIVPAGFGSALHADVTTADASLAAADFYYIEQTIEAQNVVHLAYGDATAQPVVLSFWVRSAKTGTHCVALIGDDASRYYIATYDVIAANAWEKKVILVPGDTGGSGIVADNGRGLRVRFVLAAGSNEHGTAGAWSATADNATNAQVNLLDSASNDFYLTGVQLEVGVAPTPFESKPVATELASCRRYFWRAANGDQQSLPNIVQNGASGGYPTFQFPVEMRTNPGLSYSALSHFQVDLVGSAAVPTAMSATYTSPQSSWVTVAWSAAGSDGDAVRFYTASASATLDWDCEL